MVSAHSSAWLPPSMVLRALAPPPARPRENLLPMAAPIATATEVESIVRVLVLLRLRSPPTVTLPNPFKAALPSPLRVLVATATPTEGASDKALSFPAYDTAREPLPTLASIDPVLMLVRFSAPPTVSAPVASLSASENRTTVAELAASRVLRAPAPAPERAMATPLAFVWLTPTAIEAAATVVSTLSALTLLRFSAPGRFTLSARSSAVTLPLRVFSTSTAPMLAPKEVADRPRATARDPAPRRATSSRLLVTSPWALVSPLAALIVVCAVLLVPPLTLPAFTRAVTGAVIVLVLPAPPPARATPLEPSA